jgi:hypothetical protein
MWAPPAEFVATELGGDPKKGRRLMYGLCDACATRKKQDPEFFETIKRRILEVWRSGDAHRFKIEERGSY